MLTDYCTIALISHASKVMLKILQARFQQYVNRELSHVLARFRKGGMTRYQITNIHQIIKKAREFQKNIYFCFIYYAHLCMKCSLGIFNFLVEISSFAILLFSSIYLH